MAFLKITRNSNLQLPTEADGIHLGLRFYFLQNNWTNIEAWIGVPTRNDLMKFLWFFSGEKRKNHAYNIIWKEFLKLIGKFFIKIPQIWIYRYHLRGVTQPRPQIGLPMGPCWPQKTRKQPHPQWQAEHCQTDLVIVAGILCRFRVTGQTLPDAEIWVICLITETDVRLQCHSQRKWPLTPLRRCSRIKPFLTMKNLRKRSQKRQHLLLSKNPRKCLKNAGNGKIPPMLSA